MLIKELELIIGKGINKLEVMQVNLKGNDWEELSFKTSKMYIDYEDYNLVIVLDYSESNGGNVYTIPLDTLETESNYMIIDTCNSYVLEFKKAFI